MPENRLSPRTRLRHTKIVATLGPACWDKDGIQALIRAGVNVFRINMAHGNRAEHEIRLEAIRKAAKESAREIAILADLAGPKIRLGTLPDGKIECVAGSLIRFVRGDESSDPERLVTTHTPLIDELETGRKVMLADGTVILEVEKIEEDAALCRVIQPGMIRSGQGVNLPGLKLSAPALGKDDRENAVWAARNDIDYLGLSFVRSADDVEELKTLIETEGAITHVIAKIEKPEALDDLDAIVKTADGIMIARGDLGVEIDIAKVPVVQKQIIAMCRRFHKPVIVATQMLDSMQHSRVPTRAEATDVANAIFDGADACMLSGETAIGRYPCEAVEMMGRIAMATEEGYKTPPGDVTTGTETAGVPEITRGVVRAAGELAESIDARVIAVASMSGATARTVSNSRFMVPTIGVSESRATLRKMCLYWGVQPLDGCPTDHPSKILDFVVTHAREAGYLNSGDRVVMIAGTGLRVSQHNLIVVHELD